MYVGQRGQITIPKQLRERHRIEAGDRVEFVEVHGEIVLRVIRPQTKQSLSRWVGFLKEEPQNVDEFIEEIRGR